MLDLRDLQFIRQIADHGSLARAARAMGLGQPAVSRLLAAVSRGLASLGLSDATGCPAAHAALRHIEAGPLLG